MTDISESFSEEASPLKTRELSAKSITNMRYWNVRTLFDTSKLSQVMRKMEDYNLNILGLSKVCWTDIFTCEDKTILSTGRQDGIHCGGIAIILDRSVSRALSRGMPVIDGIMMARFVTSDAKVMIVQCCEPPNDHEDAKRMITTNSSKSWLILSCNII